MWPTLFEVQTASGSWGAHTYGLLILIAFCGAFLLAHLRAQQIGLHPDKLLPAYVAAGVGGLLGGRVLYAVAVEPAELLANPLSILSFSGFAFYGGLLGGAVAVGLYAMARGIPAWKLADLAAPAVLLGLGVGRLGCFFAGCCHGAVAPPAEAMALLPEGLIGGQIWLSGSFPFLTTEFAGGVGRLLHVPLYPTQLWSAAAGIGLCALLSVLWNHRRFDGQIAALALIVEPPFRILIEAFRADHRGYVVQWEVSEAVVRWFPGLSQAGSELGSNTMGLTTSQTIGLAMMVLGVVLYALRRNAGVAPERSLEELELDEPEVA